VLVEKKDGSEVDLIEYPERMCADAGLRRVVKEK
jgi:hypothetical protein